MKKLEHILFVDDDAINNHLNKMLFEDLEIADQLTFCSNGEEGINFLLNCLQTGVKTPELIFLDLNMPVMDGFEFLTKFESINNPELETIQICVLTTSSDSGDRKKILDLTNVSLFANKPLDETKLENTWAQAFD